MKSYILPQEELVERYQSYLDYMDDEVKNRSFPFSQVNGENSDMDDLAIGSGIFQMRNKVNK